VAVDERGRDGRGGGEGGEAVVLETKLARPPIRREHLQRPALLTAISDATTRKLTLVAAPPGFGKSTALAEWAASASDVAIAWLTVDEADNDPMRFFTYVAAAVARVEPELGARCMAALRTPGADLRETVLPQFLNELSASGRDLVVVVEDYHLITSADVHEAVAYLVERSSDGLHLVISTRHDPPLPLGRLRARGALTEVRAEHLRFTEPEASAFLVGALGLELSPVAVTSLQARTEGWPAALYLAALSLRGRRDTQAAVEQFAGDDRYIVDYLTTEALARQTPELRHFLLRTSILARLTGPLCDAVAERDDSAERLAELERSNLLLVPLDSRRAWYRYHHLFRDLLQRELEATERELLPELHRRASAWYRDAGLVVDAASHAIAGGDTDAVAELVGRHYGLFVDQGQLATVLGWLEAVPDRSVGQDWLLGFAGAVAYAHAGRLDAAERWLALAEGAPATARDGQEPTGPLASITGAIRLLRGDVGGAAAQSRRALATPAAADPRWSFGPRMVLASALWWSGGQREALSLLDGAARDARQTLSPANVVYALGVLAAVQLELGIEGAEATAAEATAVVAGAGLENHPWVGMTRITEGALLASRGDRTAGAEAVERGIALGERMQAWQVVAHGSLALAEIRARQHDAAAARRLLARTRDLLAPLPDPGDGPERVARTEKVLKLRPSPGLAGAPAPYWELSQRELEVLRLLPSSLSQREIAAELYVSFNTVRTHTRVIFSKLGVTSRAEAVARARELGLI
jgi:LuxR family transcriptional regulator, maltose regulon positive regulatory protein